MLTSPLQFCLLVLTQRKIPNAQPVSTIRSKPSQYVLSKQKKSCDDKSEEEERKEKSNSKNIDTTPPSPPDPSISFTTEKYDDSRKEELREDENAMT
ncbi:hypothetical protein Tco_1540277 [Tanacetum coccineum]